MRTIGLCALAALLVAVSVKNAFRDFVRKCNGMIRLVACAGGSYMFLRCVVYHADPYHSAIVYVALSETECNAVVQDMCAKYPKVFKYNDMFGVKRSRLKTSGFFISPNANMKQTIPDWADFRHFLKRLNYDPTYWRDPVPVDDIISDFQSRWERTIMKYGT